MSSFSEEKYNELIQSIFLRFPSVQNVSFGEAYKPGLESMEEFRELLGNPDRRQGLHCQQAGLGSCRLRSESGHLHISAYSGFQGENEDR